MISPFRVVGLLEFMERYQIAKLIDYVGRLESFSSPVAGTLEGLSCAEQNYHEMLEMVEFVASEISKVGAPIAEEKFRIFRQTLTTKVEFIPHPIFKKAATWEPLGAQILARSSQDTRIRLNEELASKTMFIIPPDRAKFFEPDDPLFGTDVDRAFPSASPEIAEAGKCRALGRWTACVMHLMRALEPSLLAFQSSINVKNPKINWQDILNQIDSKIKENGHKHADHAWNSEASLQFLRFKDAWRNYAMHGKERYDEERTEAIYEGVRAFMRHLSARLSE